MHQSQNQTNYEENKLSKKLKENKFSKKKSVHGLKLVTEKWKTLGQNLQQNKKIQQTNASDTWNIAEFKSQHNTNHPTSIFDLLCHFFCRWTDTEYIYIYPQEDFHENIAQIEILTNPPQPPLRRRRPQVPWEKVI